MIHAKSHKLADMRVVLFGLVVASSVGCSERNKSVCCETEVDCRALGLPGGSVGDYGCDQGLVCVDTMCVTPPDAAPEIDGGGSGSGSSSSGRCDPSKPFGAPVLAPNINTGGNEKYFVLSTNDLSGYIVRVNLQDTITLTSTKRTTLDDDFPIDSDDPDLVNARGRIETPWLARSDRLFYEQFNANLVLCERPNAAEPFGARQNVSIGGGQPAGFHLAGFDLDALHIYFTGAADRILQRADNGFYPTGFGTPSPISTMAVETPVLSRDGLTLYYSSGDDIYVSTRADGDAMFAPGTLLFAGAGKATAITKDDCNLYTTDGDIHVARRPK